MKNFGAPLIRKQSLNPSGKETHQAKHNSKRRHTDHRHHPRAHIKDPLDDRKRTLPQRSGVRVHHCFKSRNRFCARWAERKNQDIVGAGRCIAGRGDVTDPHAAAKPEAGLQRINLQPHTCIRGLDAHRGQLFHLMIELSFDRFAAARQHVYGKERLAKTGDTGVQDRAEEKNADDRADPAQALSSTCRLFQSHRALSAGLSMGLTSPHNQFGSGRFHW